MRSNRRLFAAVLMAAAVLILPALDAGAATGPDVSSWNHVGGAAINWSAVRAAGNSFTFVKATEGPTVANGSFYTNPWYKTDAASAHAAGLYVGAYDFAEPALPVSTAALQARAFVSVVGSQRGSWQLPPTLDLEITNGLSPGTLQAWVQTWLTETTRLTGRTPMIYTSPSFWRSAMGNTTAMRGYRLWIASWTAASSPGSLPGGWPTWTMWQYTDAARVPGIPGSTDLSRYCCTALALATLADGAHDQGASNPFGSLDWATRAPGTISVGGWAIDPDTTAPINVHIYLDGRWAALTTTGVTRNDVAAAYPGWGTQRGYTATISAPPGTHQVCVYAINQGAGNSNPQLGCRTVSGDPVGALQSLKLVPGGVQVSGWVQDPDTTTPANVHIYLDGHWKAMTTGNPTSFSTDIGGMVDGPHQVCVYGIDTQHLGNNPLLGCQTVVMTGAPIGHLDGASVSDGTLSVLGWAIDPNTTGPIAVDLYVDGTFAESVTADTDRPDVGSTYPVDGPLHGFTASVAVSPGPHEVCAYGINTGLGSNNPSLGCRTVG